MKTSQVILVAIIAILIHACETQVNKPIDFKVASISNIGDFVYEGDRLVRLGDENLEYDLSGNLSSSRIFIATDTVVEFDPLWGGQYDSTYHYQLEKYSYTWINQSTLIRVTDTFIYKDVQGGLIFPQDIERYNSDTVFYWYNDLGYIDSLVNYREYPNVRYWSPYGPEYGDSSLNKERISYAYTYDEGHDEYARDGKSLIRKADTALYFAKKAGGNRLAVADEVELEQVFAKTALDQLDGAEVAGRRPQLERLTDALMAGPFIRTD